MVVLVAVASAAMLVMTADTVAATLAVAVLATPATAEPVMPGTLAHTLGLEDLTWMVTSFLVPFAGFLTCGGQLADRLGPRVVLGAGAAIFAGSTAAMMAAPSWLILLTCRAAQAGGAALMIPASLSLLIAHLPAARRRSGIGWWNGAGGAGAMLVHAGGGAIAAAGGWRALFLPGLVLAAALVCLIPALPHDTRRAGARPDGPGALLLAAGVGAAALVVYQGAHWAWTSTRVLLTGSIAVAGVAGALLRARSHPNPAVPVRLWQHGGIRWGWVMSALYGLMSAPILVFAPGYLGAAELGGWHASIVLAPISAAVLLAGPLTGALSRRWGQRTLAYGGAMAVIASGTALAWTTREPAGPDPLAALVALTGLGAGLGIVATVAASAASQTRLPDQIAATGAAGMTMRQGGGALGVAGAAALLERPFLTGAEAGYHSILAVCLSVAGLAGVAAVIRPLWQAWIRRRSLAHPVTGSTPQIGTAPLTVPREALVHLHQALREVAQAADDWLLQHQHSTAQVPVTWSMPLSAPPSPPPSPPPQLVPTMPPVSSGNIARRCACHPELDPLEATLWHSTRHVPVPHRPARQLLHPLHAPEPTYFLGDPHAR
ncbi:MFS transporter [Nonomuraea ceibae]|uniref:MFS transporter n=1 Tax=Nonomuraea ceibae TaxID=1935170 RepID=UPI001C5DC932|nr:MFS transporter [Nonomuraea ceibae]